MASLSSGRVLVNQGTSLEPVATLANDPEAIEMADRDGQWSLARSRNMNIDGLRQQRC